ncbi:efflux RND transporter permease subunit [Galenea microaerophila]
MINRIISISLASRSLILLFSIVLAFWGWQAVKQTPLDAIPDLSDVQVIIKTSYPGQAPQVVEDQVTYPIASLMMSVPSSKAVRGYSFLGDSYVYVIFKEGTDPYWARSRVLEYLNQVKGQLPAGVQPTLGPDATGVGWVFEYALVDPSHQNSLADLRSLQDWFLKYELQAIPGVSEVATVGGMVKQYQVVVRPNALRVYGLTLQQVEKAIQQSSAETGASVIEQAEAEYMVQVKGYVTQLKDLRNVPVSVDPKTQTPILLRQIADIRLGPQMRRGIAELNGMGEVVGGIVVMRSGENALHVIQAVKQKLESLKGSLPKGVNIVETYDRSGLIQRAVDNLNHKLIEEMVVVALVTLLFLLHFRSSLVAIISLPLGVLGAFIVMQQMGVTANIMSLGGIAIAIGAMVDATIVMIENAHKHLEHYRAEHGHPPQGRAHWKVIEAASIQVAPSLFLSLLIIALSFVPIFALEGQAGKLFAPLALTKTLAMAIAAGLSITLVPVLMGYFIRGRLPDEHKNPLNGALVWLYQRLMQWALKWRWGVMMLSVLLVVSMIYPWQKMGSEFMPELQEGDLLYMPTTLPGLSIGEAQALLQQSDRLIKTFPEVKTVFGKIGRAETATDPAPLTMIETTIQLKPQSEWRPGMTLNKLIAELNQKVRFPGVTNAWVQPIKTRIDMLSTGIKTPIGIKVAGDDLETIEMIGQKIERVVSQIPGTLSAFSDRVTGGRYITIIPDRASAARYGLSIQALNNLISVAVGGKNLLQTVEGRERYPINLRYPQSWRNSVAALKALPIVTDSGAHIQLSQVAQIKVHLGPPMLKSENARLNGWVFVDLDRDTDIADYVKRAKAIVAQKVSLPAGYSVTWSGQYEALLKAQKKMTQIVPLTLLIIFVLLFLIFKRMGDALLVMAMLPFAVIGSIWLLWALDYRFSVAVAVGVVALAGVAAEFGVIMLLYLKQALAEAANQNRLNTPQEVKAAIMNGAVKRVRPIAMTVAVILVGLLPIMLGSGTGSEVMKRIAAPMVGGMITAPIVSMILIPVIVYWRTVRAVNKGEKV